LSKVKVIVLFMPTMRLLEKLGQAHMPQARSVVLIIHMRVWFALIHPVRPGVTRWTAGIASCAVSTAVELLRRSRRLRAIAF